jgi:hypothetical protein
VPLDHGAILLTRQVMLRHLLRMEEVGRTCNKLETLKELAYAMGFLGDRIGKLSTIGIKTKVAAEEAAEEIRKRKQPGWAPGTNLTPVQITGPTTVHMNTGGNPAP